MHFCITCYYELKIYCTYHGTYIRMLVRVLGYDGHMKLQLPVWCKLARVCHKYLSIDAKLKTSHSSTRSRTFEKNVVPTDVWFVRFLYSKLLQICKLLNFSVAETKPC